MQYSITESEQLILQQLWSHGSMSIMQLTAALTGTTGWSRHAVISFLKRMEEKGTVTYAMQGRTRYYSAVPGEAEVLVDSAGDMLDRYFGGKIGRMVLYMAEANRLTDRDVDELQDLLDRLKEENSGKT